MNHEERYNQALKRAKVEQETFFNLGNVSAKTAIERIFPELRESEDERIRREIMEYITSYKDSLDDDEYRTWISWLEKQGEKSEYNPYKATVESIAEMCKSYSTSTDLHDFYDNVRVKCKDAMEYDKTWTEKQGEQKPTDEIKPKFKVGDWITNGKHTWKVTDIKPLDYILQSQNGDVVDDTISYVDEEFHLWTIQDAKDGDVLSQDSIPFIFKSWDNNCIAYCGITGFGLFKVVEDYFSWCNGINVTPATKEQRDLLFQKMKEAGYVWYAEKKELKKIYQEYPLTPSECFKPTWSEEDEKMVEDIIEAIDTQYAVSDYNEMVSWLKSLKPQNRWKPTEEQLGALKYFISFHEDHARSLTTKWEEFKNLESLYNDLKSFL